jgi:hypothetical protein
MTEHQIVLQPYPLFYAELDDGKVRSGRIIGWQGVNDIVNMQPVVMFEQPDGTTGDLSYVEPNQVQYCWIRENLHDATDAAVQMLRSERT